MNVHPDTTHYYTSPKRVGSLTVSTDHFRGWLSCIALQLQQMRHRPDCRRVRPQVPTIISQLCLQTLNKRNGGTVV